MSFLTDVVKGIDNSNLLSEGGNSSEFSGSIDTGSYILNAVLSGSLYGGVPNNKITAFAGESATGKTFFVLGVLKQFLKDNPDGGVIYFDTEAAVTKDMMSSRGIDPSKVVIVEPASIEDFRTSATRILTNYNDEVSQPLDQTFRIVSKIFYTSLFLHLQYNVPDLNQFLHYFLYS